MPRAPRIEFAGAIYHVMNRGNQLRAIFRDEKDRQVFVATLGETAQSAGWAIHSFVLMGNHYHLLIETSRPTLVKGMQYLNSTYTLRFNARHRIRGHLFAGRYKALLVDGEARGYFLTVSDYIHLNPVRVGRAKDLKELWADPWSSAGWLAGMRKGCPPWLRWERVYGELGLGNWRSRSRREYRQYLGQRMAEASGGEWKKIRRGWCLGSEGFIEEMKGRLSDLAAGERERDSWGGEAVDEMEEDLALRLLKVGCHKLGYSVPGESKGMDRHLLGRWVRLRTKVGVKWLASQLKVASVGTMSYGIWYVGQQIAKDSRLRKRWNLLQS